MASIWCKDILKVWRFSSHSKVGRCTICTLSGKIGEEAIHSGEAISMPCRSLVMLARAIQFCIAFDSSYLDPSLPSAKLQFYGMNSVVQKVIREI